MNEYDDKYFKIHKRLKKIMIENVIWCYRCQKDYLKIILKKPSITIDKNPNEIIFN